MTDYSNLRKIIDEKLNNSIASFYQETPFAKHQLEAKEIDIEYYKRHHIETILRIRLARIADAKATVLFTKTNPKIAKMWAEYMDDEMLHDVLFLKDLSKFNVKENDVYSTKPFISTQLLQGFLYYSIEHDDPKALITKSYCLEYTTQLTQPFWVNNLKSVLGEEYVTGQIGHLNVDEDEDHVGEVWNVLTKLIKSEKDEQDILYYINIYEGLSKGYFNELYNSTILNKKYLSVSLTFS